LTNFVNANIHYVTANNIKKHTCRVHLLKYRAAQAFSSSVKIAKSFLSTGSKHHLEQESPANAKVSAQQPCWSKTDFDVKLALKVILGHSFCNQLQADKG